MVEVIDPLLAILEWNGQPLNPRYPDFRHLHSLVQIRADLVAKV